MWFGPPPTDSLLYTVNIYPNNIWEASEGQGGEGGGGVAWVLFFLLEHARPCYTCVRRYFLKAKTPESNQRVGKYTAQQCHSYVFETCHNLRATAAALHAVASVCCRSTMTIELAVSADYVATPTRLALFCGNIVCREYSPRTHSSIGRRLR